MTENVKKDAITSNEHGSITSYVIGFILSLILTIVPYYAVTRQVISSTTLLLAILALAIAQMLVQIFFFLHLGRGPKPLYNVVFFVATACMITMVVGASILIMDNLYRNMSPEEVTTRLAQDENIAEVGGQQTGACQGNNANHTVVITENTVSPQHVDAQRCDTLTITIQDGIDRELAFGSPESSMSYGGLDELSVRSNRSKILTLNETGDFSFYDQESYGAIGHFTVEP